MKYKINFENNKVIVFGFVILALVVCCLAYWLLDPNQKPTAEQNPPASGAAITEKPAKVEGTVNYAYYKDQYRVGIPSREGWAKLSDETSEDVKIGNFEFGVMQIGRYIQFPKEMTLEERFVHVRDVFNDREKESGTGIEYVFDTEATTFETPYYQLDTQRLVTKKTDGSPDEFFYIYLYDSEKYSYIMVLMCDKKLLMDDPQYEQDVNHILYTFEILNEESNQ